MVIILRARQKVTQDQRPSRFRDPKNTQRTKRNRRQRQGGGRNAVARRVASIHSALRGHTRARGGRSFDLAASLLFIPHYEVTRAPEVGAVLLTTDAKGYAYVASQSVKTSAASVTKLDPDGNLVYEVSPMTNAGNITASVLDAAGNIYLAPYHPLPEDW